MTKKILSLVLLIGLFNNVFSQIKLHGVTLPAKLGKDDKLLTINGGGIRKHFFIDTYVAGLYLSKKNGDATEIIHSDKPIAVRLQIVSSLVTQERMTESVREGFKKATGGNTKPIQKEIDLISKVFNSEPIKIGDYFDIWYLPGKGVSASKNGKKIDVVIPGLQFKKTLYSIWLGKDPVDEELKDDMLGL